MVDVASGERNIEWAIRAIVKVGSVRVVKCRGLYHWHAMQRTRIGSL